MLDKVLPAPKIAATKSNFAAPISPQFSPPTTIKICVNVLSVFISFFMLTLEYDPTGEQ